MSDRRRLSDVKPRGWPTLEECYGDPVLHGYGWSGEPKIYQLRLRRIRELALEGRGPGAAPASYVSPWRPHYPPGSTRVPTGGAE